jgi:putative glutamine amidotransferase
MTMPRIGITPSRRVEPARSTQISVPEAYVQAVTAAGGAPFIIPLGLPEAVLAEIIPTLDGILFSGGGDVHPGVYGSQDHPLVDGVDHDRDRVELDAFSLASKRQLPFLGICRGFQLINVALGGTLYEDILDQHPGALDHRYQDGNSRSYLAHPVAVSPGSCLAEILGQTTVDVNSMHHQGVRSLAAGLQASAAAPDGIIEAFEMPGHPFGMAVQWHPECLQEHQPMQRLFQAFVKAAAGQPV